ncbi:MAG: aquaporin [Gemmataceae bacterium]|nr:aquaporin [Gemmataceae bacterium]
MRKLAAEAFGTFCLVFAGTGAIIANDLTGAVTHVGVSLTFGLVVFAMIQAVGGVSGAHLNPAATLGLCLAGRFSWKSMPGYVAAQCAGAFAASLALRSMFASHPTLGATLPVGDPSRSFVLEIVLTLILVFVALGSTGPLAGAAVGSVVALEALFAGPISGASMNPARSLAPAVVSGRVEHLWIYLVAPMLGAAVGAGLSRVIHGEERK